MKIKTFTRLWLATLYPGVGHGSYKLAWKEPEMIEWLFRQRRR